MVDLDTLIALFYQDSSLLGEFEKTPQEEVPEPYHQLLVHEHHMTVTVEKFHESLVDVVVLEKQSDDVHYSRKILLRKQTDGKIVQFGIVRLNLNFLEKVVRDEILSEQIPLGRALINHNVLRQVHLFDVWKVAPGPDLCSLLKLDPAQVIYGRTAIIDCNNEPAIELLEIVTPD